ncbi:hypothetical protein SAMN04489832_0707 [Micromonospora cremea]|uniref:Uncharacterized protein n=1 Tax=Micromonospora cremea TaxID=709881 RepID=A0A1N5U8P9_9ACTN|nr:hypothetical protein SAMN04489832_0707 [Micromonospora cremea]
MPALLWKIDLWHEVSDKTNGSSTEVVVAVGDICEHKSAVDSPPRLPAG